MKQSKEYENLWNNTLQKLREIAKLEEENNVVGISFAIDEDEGKTLTTEESLDFVEESLDFISDFIKNAVHFIAHREELHAPGFCPPE